MSSPSQQIPILKTIKIFIDNYTKGGGDDLRAVKDFRICETDEAISSLRAELNIILNNKVPTPTLDSLVGKKRVVKHGSYQEWAKAMMIWLTVQI